MKRFLSILLTIIMFANVATVVTFAGDDSSLPAELEGYVVEKYYVNETFDDETLDNLTVSAPDGVTGVVADGVYTFTNTGSSVPYLKTPSAADDGAGVYVLEYTATYTSNDSNNKFQASRKLNTNYNGSTAQLVYFDGGWPSGAALKLFTTAVKDSGNNQIYINGTSSHDYKIIVDTVNGKTWLYLDGALVATDTVKINPGSVLGATEIQGGNKNGNYEAKDVFDNIKFYKLFKPSIEIESENSITTALVGTDVAFNVEADVLEGDTLKYYLNDDTTGVSVADGTFTIPISEGANEVYVKSESGVTSNTVTITGRTGVVINPATVDETLVGTELEFTLGIAGIDPSTVRCYKDVDGTETEITDIADNKFMITIDGYLTKIYAKVDDEVRSDIITIPGVEKVIITALGETENIPIGDEVEFSVNDDAVINSENVRYYVKANNVETEITTVTDNKIKITVAKGINEVYAKINDVIEEDSKVTVTGIEQIKISSSVVPEDENSANVLAGQEVSFTVDADVVDDSTLKYYVNDVEKESVANGGNFAITVTEGTNRVYVKAGTVQSNEITITGVSAVTIERKDDFGQLYAGSKVVFNLSVSVDENDNVRYYVNDEPAGEVIGNEFSVIIAGGENKVQVKSDNITSNSIIVNGIGYTIPKTYADEDFSDESFNGVTATTNSGFSGGVENGAYQFEVTGASATLGNSSYLKTASASSDGAGIYVIEVKAKFDSTETDNKFNATRQIKLRHHNGTSYDIWSIVDWNYSNTHANLMLRKKSSNIDTGVDIYPGDEHTYKLIVDSVNAITWLYIDDEVVAKNVSSLNPDSQIGEVQIITGYTSGSQDTFDDFKFYKIAPDSTISVAYGVDGNVNDQEVPYSKDNAMVTVTFSEPVDNTALTSENITVTDANGSPVAITLGTYDSVTNSISFTPVKDLNPDFSYTLKIDSSKIKTASGGILIGEDEFAFKTDRLPFCIDEITLYGDGVVADSVDSNKGKTVTANVKFRNTERVENAVLFIGVFSDNTLENYTYVPVTNLQVNPTETTPVSGLVIPAVSTEDYKIKACLVKGVSDLNIFNLYTLD